MEESKKSTGSMCDGCGGDVAVTAVTFPENITREFCVKCIRRMELESPNNLDGVLKSLKDNTLVDQVEKSTKIQKSWGFVYPFSYTDRIKIKPGEKCSIHYHVCNSNRFIVESGVLHVRYYVKDEDYVATVRLCANETLMLDNGVVHQFEAENHVTAIEEYYGPYGREDIVRLEEWPYMK